MCGPDLASVAIMLRLAGATEALNPKAQSAWGLGPDPYALSPLSSIERWTYRGEHAAIRNP